ncbi:MAG: sugar ABC transporter permease [Spirochaetaceae bacterium]|nr:MAG: sugar ABC transporter permease [Spirochaetaceae bacterium]
MTGLSKSKILNKFTIVLFLAPALMLLSFVMIYPIAMGIAMSFSEIELGEFTLTFKGVQQFEKLFKDPTFWRTVQNSLIWVAGCTAGQFVTGLLLALLLNRRLPGISVFRIILLLPWTIPGVVTAFTWFWLYHPDYGMISWVIRIIRGTALSILSNENTALPAVMLVNVWWRYPFAMLMLLAGLQTVPSSHYDAAAIDGANSIQVLRHIIIPWLRPVITIVLILDTIANLNGFTLVRIMTGGGPGGVTDLFGILIYRKGFAFFHFEEAAAVSFIVLILAVLLATLYIKIVNRRGGSDE